jgi:hypothetical protein
LSDPEVESSSLSHPKRGRNDDEKLRDAMGRRILSSSQMIRAPLSFDLLFLSFFSGLADNFDPLIYFLSSPNCQSTAVAGSQLPLPAMMPPPLQPPLSLRLHLLFRSETLIPLLRRRPSCDAPHCRTRRYISVRASAAQLAAADVSTAQQPALELGWFFWLPFLF